MTAPRLSQRLRAVLQLVPGVVRDVADVGAGHGALAVHLALRGGFVIATESQPGPFAELQRNLARWDAAGCVEARHGDGLTVLRPGEVETVVVAGMGARTALHILIAAREQRVHRAVVQTMQRHELVEPWFQSNGWRVRERADVAERDRTYPVWLAELAA
jgi:tRNA (adenine22-N1)-methyltransferase